MVVAQQETTQRNYRSYNDTPNDKLHRGYMTIGENVAEKLGLKATGTTMRGRRSITQFNVNFVKALPRTPGLLWIDDTFGYVNGSKGEDDKGNAWERLYGAVTGIAHVNIEGGYGTMSSSIPALITSDYKGNADQRNALSAEFSALCRKHGKLMAGGLEVNPTSVSLFESKEHSADGIPSFRFVLIEAAGIFGENDKGQAYYASVRKHPVVKTEGEEKVEQAEKPAPRSRQRRPSVQDAPVNTDGESAMAEEGELVNAG
jgi:hypothetical protein